MLGAVRVAAPRAHADVGPRDDAVIDAEPEHDNPSGLGHLASRLTGDLVRPGQPAYPRARELFNPRFDHIRPDGVAYCESADDVTAAVLFARDAGLPLALRSGGHSYAGWSTGTGLVLDVSRMSGVRGVRRDRDRRAPARG